MFKLISKLLGQSPQQEIAVQAPKPTQTENTLDKLKEQINTAIEQGQFERAITTLQEAIRLEKENAGLYVNLAFCLLQQGKIAEAESFLHQALQQDEKHIDAHFMLASVLANQGKHDTAIKEYETVLALNPSFAFAYKELAILYLQQQQIEQASAVIDKGLTAAPTFADLHFLRGNIYLQSQQLESAIGAYQTTIKLDLQFSQAYSRLALAFEQHSQIDSAIQALQSLSNYQAHDISTLLQLGRLYMQNNQIEKALEQFDKVLKIDTNSVEALANSGNMLLSLGKEQQAISRFDAALALNPQLAPIWQSKATVAYNHGDYATSFEFASRALLLSPKDAEIHHLYGLSLTGIERYEEAIEQYQLAIQLKPQHPLAYYDLGKTRLRLEQYEAALKDLTHSLTINPNLPEANLDIGFAYLAMGDLERGFRQYEWRWRCSPLKDKLRPFSAPEWQGQKDIRGKTILLYAEQGLGDMIQMLRYVTEVANLGARVILEVHPPLIRLCKNFPGVAEVYKGGDILPPHDLRAPIMSLPYLFKTNIASIPLKESYFDHALIQQTAKHDWASEIKPSSRKKVGVAWAGNRDFMHDKKRSIPFELFSEIFKQDADFYCLQKELSKQDLDQLKSFPSIEFRGDKLTDLLETAALISHLDLVITVDTSIAHLAGAMGKEVWIMLPFNPDWRWLLNRTDSPWYTHVRLFRQARLYDWESVIQALRKELDAILQ